MGVLACIVSLGLSLGATAQSSPQNPAAASGAAAAAGKPVFEPAHKTTFTEVTPFNVSTGKGGTLELCARGEGGFDQNSFRHFQVMSNELSTPKILVCPADPSRQLATNFVNLQANNVSYLIRSGTNITDLTPQEVLAHCPVHGHDALCDGSVRQGKMK